MLQVRSPHQEPVVKHWQHTIALERKPPKAATSGGHMLRDIPWTLL